MSTFLLLVGLSLFVSGAAMYLAHAARHDPRWVAGSLFFPFVVPLYYRRNWDELYAAGLLQSAGLAMAAAGVLMLLFQSARPDGLVTADTGELFSSVAAHQDSGFVDSERALKLLVRHGPGTPVSGRVHGQRFHPDRVEFVDNTLRLTEGATFLPDREIAIRFPEGSIDSGVQVKRAIGPDDADAPEVQVTWRGDDGEPVTEVFRSGYRLEFDIAPLVRSKLSGYIQIMLPDRWESFVAGDITVITSHLRYKGSEVDRHFDHEDTLRFIAEEYLRSQYAESDIDTVTFNNLSLDPLAGTGETLAAVRLKDGRVGNHVVKVAKNEFGWSVLIPESAAATTAAGYKPVYNVLPPTGLQAPVVERTAAVTPVRKPVERTLEFAQMGALSGQGATVEYRSGRKEQGVLRGMRKDRLVFEAMKGGGVVEYLVAEQELARLRMNTGEVINLAGYTPAAAAAAATVSAPATQAPAATESLQFAGVNVGPYMNRTVKVVTKGGKATVGVMRGVTKEGLVVETQVGGGKVNYTVTADQFGSIDYASR